MTGELINMDGVGTALMAISDKLGMTLLQMYDVYFRAQFVMAIVQIVFILLWCIITACIIYYTYKLRSCIKRNHYSDMPLMIEMLAVTLCAGFTIGILLLFLYDPVIAIFCPDYTALQSLIHDIENFIK
jgi:hypothetical protein